MVRRVGYKLGGSFNPLPARDEQSGVTIRDSTNRVVLDSDFTRVLDEFEQTPTKLTPEWNGATVEDILSHKDLDMKPRRISRRALENIRELRNNGAEQLDEIALVLEETVDLIDEIGAEEFRRVVEGQDIRAVEGTVVPHAPERCWSISERKKRKCYLLQSGDIVVGLVRPERRNIGILLDTGEDIVGSPDGLSVVRVKPEMAEIYPMEWLFAVLRSERVRLQLWTESGGTSYGKLDNERIRQVLIPTGTLSDRRLIADSVRSWISSVQANIAAWSRIGTEEDRVPILNSPLTGLVDDYDAP